MQIVAVPLFDQNMSVEAYMFRYLKQNNLFSTAQAISVFDGASHSVALETLSEVGLEAFTLGKPLFVPINYIMLLGNLHLQCKEPPDKIIFVFEEPPKEDNLYVSIIRSLRNMGYRFACNYPADLQNPDPVLENCSFIFLSQRPEKEEQTAKTLAILRKDHPDVHPIATHIYNTDKLKSLYNKSYVLYESRFYKVAANQSEQPLNPLKVNSIGLINTVQDEDFQFEQVTSIIQRDPALALSLFQMVNAQSKGGNKVKNVDQAVALLGQKEVRKWVTTAVAGSLGDDRPNEITRISLVRAKFAENLAPMFGLAVRSSELFLAGLFSVLDIMLGVPMVEALALVHVTDDIEAVLINGAGIFAPLMKLVTDYENASWSAVSRHMIVNNIQEDDLANAFTDALIWYRKLVLDNVATKGEEDAKDAATISTASVKA